MTNDQSAISSVLARGARPRLEVFLVIGHWSLVIFLLTAVADHRLQVLGVALDGQHDGALLDAIGRDGDGRYDLPAVGETETHGERAVAAQFDRLALEHDAGGRLGAAV